MRIKIRFQAACPRHRRYDPSRDGPGAIKGCCPACEQLWRIELARRQLERAVEQLIEMLEAHPDPWVAAAMVRSETAAATTRAPQEKQKPGRAAPGDPSPGRRSAPQLPPNRGLRAVFPVD